LKNLIQIVDDEGNTYNLASGNITTDSNGNITGSDSGLIIGVDANGDFVSLSDKHLTVQPTGMTLDQYEEAERIKLQEQVTTVTDPTGEMQPQEQQTTPQLFFYLCMPL
jgi:hypothetical protein